MKSQHTILTVLREEIAQLPSEYQAKLIPLIEHLAATLHDDKPSSDGETTYNYSTLNTTMASGFLLCDMTGKIESCNAFAANLLGYSEKQLVGKSIFDTSWHPVLEDGTPILSSVNHPIAQLITENEVQGNFSLGYHRPDHILIWLYMNVRLYFHQGQAKGFVVKFMDITDYRQMLDALRKSETHQRILINENSDGILLIDQENRIQFVNPAAEKLMGKPASGLIGETFAYCAKTHKEFSIQDRIIEMRGVDITWEDEPMVLVSLRDITERKTMEESLRHTAEELANRNQELDAYSHTIAHGLKNPLAVVMGYNSLIRQQFSNLPSDVFFFLDEIEDSVRDMTSMINNLLYLAHLRDPRHVVEPVEMNIVARKALKRYENQLTKRGIRVSFETDLPIGMGQETWLEEVFANFISNAIKYIGKKNPAPEICIEGQLDGHMARYMIKDNGIGIAPENQASLFEKFTRYAPSVEGSGLGLSIVRRIINRLGGEVGVESELGKGSTFWFTLPVPQ